MYFHATDSCFLFHLKHTSLALDWYFFIYTHTHTQITPEQELYTQNCVGLTDNESIPASSAG